MNGPVNPHDDAFVQNLFDRMGPTYELMNVFSSFGFSELWRRACVNNAQLLSNARICDMMSGSGELWRYALRGENSTLVSVDFSGFMVELQKKRQPKFGKRVQILRANALQTGLESGSFDAVVCGFGLKTLSREMLDGFAREIARILKPGGRFSLMEVSTAEGWFLAPVYLWYLSSVIPVVGRLCLGDIECYRMLGRYTKEFGSCEHAREAFARAGLDVSLKKHFFGCATSLVGRKP